ncbi:MAG: GtrA family protein [Mucinivorans sp.]
MGRFLARLIDFFYFPCVARFVPRDTFRYAAVGGLNLALSVVLYSFFFHILLRKGDTRILGFVVISAPILAFMLSFVLTFLSGFWLTRNVAFGGSSLKGSTQLFRYAQVVGVNLLINYFGLKLFVEVWGFYPTPSYLSLQIATVGVSYLASKHYTFRK